MNINWSLLGRSWKSCKPKLEPALLFLSAFKRNHIFFTPTLMHKMFGDACERNWYRRINDLEILQVIHSPKIINEFGWVYSKNQRKSRTFKIDKQLLINSGYSQKIPTTRIVNDFEPEIKHSCYVIKDFYKYTQSPEILAKLLMSKRTNVKFGNPELTLKSKFDNWSDDLCGPVCIMDFKVFFDDINTFNHERYDRFIQTLKNYCIKVPGVIQQEVIAYNELITDDNFKYVFKPRITIKWSATKIQVNIFCRGLSYFSNSPKLNRQEWLDKIGLDVENRFDIVATVPSVIRLVNKGKWDHKDPRMMIANNSGITIPFNNLKSLIFKLIFTKNAENAWFHYNTIQTKYNRWLKLDRLKNKIDSSDEYVTTNKGERINLDEHLTEKEFHKLYNETQKVIGESLGVKVFFYESMIELLAMRHLQKNKFTVVNVYDCFFFNSTEKQMKIAIKKAAFETLNLINN